MAELAVLDTTMQKTHEWLKDIADGLGFPNQRFRRPQEASEARPNRQGREEIRELWD
jgi:hypothetical protein